MKFEKPNVVVSKCLEHGNCRYDGSKISDQTVKRLMDHVNFIPLCPEMEIGLPSPRQALRIIEDNGVEDLVFSLTGETISDKMNSYSSEQVSKLKDIQIDGFILKSRSPSCGIKDVKVYKSHGKSNVVPKKVKGYFGRAICDEFSDIAIEDEGRLTNFNIREHFFTRIYTNSSFRAVKSKNSINELIKFHSECKYLFMAYNQSILKQMGKLVANHEKDDIKFILDSYEVLLNKLLSTAPGTMRYINVMMHIFGYFSNELSSKEKAYFLDALEKYREKRIPGSVVMSILESWVVRFDNDYLASQRIFQPFPMELVEVTDSGKGL